MKTKQLFITGFVATSLIFSAQLTQALTSDSYQLWKDEATSKSLNPENLDNLINGVYTNNQFGYKLSIPSNWEVDRHQVPNYTRFFNEDFRLDIYFDDLGKKYKKVDEYINETIEPVKPLITKEGTYNTNSGLKIRTFDYKRSPLSGIQNDMTSYSYFFVISGNKVYTLQLKTFDNNFENKKQEIIKLLTSPDTSFFEGKMDNVNDSFAPNKTSPDIELKAEKRTLKIEPNKIAFGIYQPGQASGIHDVETNLKTRFGAQMFYKPIDKPYDSYVETMVSEGRVPLVTMHFDYINENTNTSDNVQKVINGAFDTQITSWAEGIKNTKSPVLVRVGNEMNGNWTSWSHKNSYNDPDLYKLAYRHVINVYKQHDVTNAYFVWNPNDYSKPDYSWNAAAMYYPGDNYVNWLGMTAYNFGKTGKDFKYFDDLYGDLYKTYMRSFANKPMLIGEFASSEAAGNKPYFVGDMFEKIKEKYPNLKLVIWFNGEPENGLPINSSVESEAAFKEVVKHPIIVQHPIIDNIPSGINLSVKNNSETNNSNLPFTGTVTDSKINSISINGISKGIQFNENIKLQKGVNKIDITVSMKDGTQQDYDYFVYKKSSFTFSTPVSERAINAPISNASQILLTGLVTDKDVASLKINGVTTAIKWGWKQFDSQPIILKNGLNEFVLEGYDSNGKLITKESFYVFKDGDMKVTSPSANNSSIFSNKATITGLLQKPNLKWVKVDGMNQTLKFSWRQFDQPLDFGYGDNSFYVDSIYEYVNLNGEKVYFPIHNQYNIHAPSFNFLNSVNYVPTNAGQIAGKSAFVEGIIKDTRINSLKINGEKVTLLYDWNQFRHPVSLKNGFNAFTITGYSDSNYQNKIVEETVYLFNDNDLVMTTAKETYVNTTKDVFTFTGYAASPKLKTLKINGINQTFKFGWRQFDQPITLSKPGNNNILVEATYEDIINGYPYTKVFNRTYTIHKPSFKFDTPVSYTIPEAPQTSNTTQPIKGTVIDNTVKSLKINGAAVSIGSDKKFSYAANLRPGLNEIKLVGYSDSSYKNQLFEEVVFIFNDKGFTVQSPSSPTIKLDTKELKISGILEYSNYKSLKINGEKTDLLYDWRQFSKNVTLPVGKNTLVLEATYEGTYKGAPYTYIAKKKYTVTVPEGISNYKFTTPVGNKTQNAPKTKKGTEWIGALVKNGTIKAVKVNGKPATIQYSWKQFSIGVPMKKGMNAIKIEGFSDVNYKKKIDEETVYIFRQ
ncbi:glycosyl hydrolase [Bacillus cereus]|uniref:glycosyl hydrolase n=1 Tax=Bacillus cereus TaxID=1396 RepID=UPI003078F2E8